MTSKTEKQISKEKITQDVAEHEFERFADTWDIETDTAAMSEEDEQSFLKQKKHVLRALVRGNLRLDDDGNPIQKLREPVRNIDEISYKMPRGDIYSALAKAKKHSNPVFLVLNKMTNVNAGVFEEMSALDLKVSTAISTLFLD